MCYDADIGKGFLTRTQHELIMKNGASGTFQN